MTFKRAAAVRPTMMSGVRRALLAASVLLAFLATACGECAWGETCGDFSCLLRDAGLGVGDTTAVTLRFCAPHDALEAVYTISSVSDSTIVDAAIDGRNLILIGKKSGYAAVGVDSRLPGSRNTGLLMFEITVYDP